MFKIEENGGASLGRCYRAHGYRITSDAPLDMEQFEALRASRLIGYGQEWNVHQVIVEDGKVKATAEVPAKFSWHVGGTSPRDIVVSEIVDGKGAFAYHVNDLIDSSD